MRPCPLTWAGAQYFFQYTMCAQQRTQISLRIQTFWLESSHGTLWVVKDPKRFQEDSDDS